MPKQDKIELDKRIRIVQEWIIEDWPACDIVANIVNKWGLSDRHAKRYIAEARKRWNSEENALVEHRRRLKIESLKKLKRSLQEKYKGTPKGISAIVRVETLIIKLEGLELPTKIEHSGKDGKPIQSVTTIKTNVDYSQLPTEILEQIVKARIKPTV